MHVLKKQILPVVDGFGFDCFKHFRELVNKQDEENVSSPVLIEILNHLELAIDNYLSRIPLERNGENNLHRLKVASIGVHLLELAGEHITLSTLSQDMTYVIGLIRNDLKLEKPAQSPDGMLNKFGFIIE